MSKVTGSSPRLCCAKASTQLLSGDVESGKILLRDYIKATAAFEKLGAVTGAPPRSLIRMFGPRGNPQAKNLFSILGDLQKRAGVRLQDKRGVRLEPGQVFAASKNRHPS